MNSSPMGLNELFREACSQRGCTACPPAESLLAAALGERGPDLAAAREALASCPVCAAAARRALAVHRALAGALPATEPAPLPLRGRGWLAVAAGSALFALALAVSQGPSRDVPGAGLAGSETAHGLAEHDERLFASSFNEGRPDRIFSPAML